MPDESTEQDTIDREPIDRESGDPARGLGGFAAGILVGAALGVGLALLFAPERGETTRRRLRRRLARLREEAGGGLERAAKRASRELERRRR